LHGQFLRGANILQKNSKKEKSKTQKAIAKFQKGHITNKKQLPKLKVEILKRIS
jgi:hypothetical protein